MPRPPEKTHQRLIDAAQVFARDGFQRAGTREIAKEAGVNEVTLFRQFQSKEKLPAAVFECSIASQADALADSGPWTRDLHQDLIDAVAGRKFVGKIESFSPATGAQFALLPADNATGNFTKVVQRLPVKITFDPQSIAGCEEKIRAGLSTIVSGAVR